MTGTSLSDSPSAEEARITAVSDPITRAKVQPGVTSQRRAPERQDKCDSGPGHSSSHELTGDEDTLKEVVMDRTPTPKEEQRRQRVEKLLECMQGSSEPSTDDSSSLLKGLSSATYFIIFLLRGSIL